MIYHITTHAAWRHAVENGLYTAPSLTTEGFIHCSTREQVIPVGNAFYRDTPDCVLLAIDDAQIASALVWEAPAHPDGTPAVPTEAKFPHVYAPIPMSAVVQISPFTRDASGLY
ncbi:DUF952 domain-containing protein, partial [bacterium]|nr:DUF952 domain-containing protein [bacterium]